MRAPFLALFPQLLDGIVIGRIAGQVEHRQAVLVLLEERLHRCAGMITGAVLNY